MLRIEIESNRIRIGSAAVVYYPYYFDTWDRHGDSGIPVLRRVCGQWARAVRGLDEGLPLAYLPYSLDDEAVETFRATLTGDSIALRCVTVAANGYALDLDDLRKFMRDEHRVLAECPEEFGVFDRDELAKGLEYVANAAT